MSIYQNFWADVDAGDPIVFLHRAFPRVKAIPSIIDVITFQNEGVDKLKVEKIVADLNEEYAPFMKKLETDYKKMILFEEKRLIYNTIKTFKTLSLSCSINILKKSKTRCEEKYSPLFLYGFSLK